MRRLLGLGAMLGTAALALSGCGTAVSGWNETLSLDSDPSGARCRLERMSQPIAVVTTPAAVVVPRSQYPLEIYCEKDGNAGTLVMSSELNLFASAGNVTTAMLGWIPDAMTGGGYTYYPDEIIVRFPVRGQGGQ